APREQRRQPAGELLDRDAELLPRDRDVIASQCGQIRPIARPLSEADDLARPGGAAHVTIPTLVGDAGAGRGLRRADTADLCVRIAPSAELEGCRCAGEARPARVRS